MDSEIKPLLCRIMAVAVRIAEDHVPANVSRPWIARYLKSQNNRNKKSWNR